MARQGDARRGVEGDHGRRGPEADGRDAFQRPAHVLGRVREDRGYRRGPADRAGRRSGERLSEQRTAQFWKGDRTMSDVRETSAPRINQQERTGPNPTGDFIWYELMTTDAEAAKDFYDAVVGWNFGEGAEEYQGYRMINTRDGGFAGGVMPITNEMQQHGARPTWLGYLNVNDVDEK